MEGGRGYRCRAINKAHNLQNASTQRGVKQLVIRLAKRSGQGRSVFVCDVSVFDCRMEYREPAVCGFRGARCSTIDSRQWIVCNFFVLGRYSLSLYSTLEQHHVHATHCRNGIAVESFCQKSYAFFIALPNTTLRPLIYLIHASRFYPTAPMPPPHNLSPSHHSLRFVLLPLSYCIRCILYVTIRTPNCCNPCLPLIILVKVGCGVAVARHHRRVLRRVAPCKLICNNCFVPDVLFLSVRYNNHPTGDS